MNLNSLQMQPIFLHKVCQNCPCFNYCKSATVLSRAQPQQHKYNQLMLLKFISGGTALQERYKLSSLPPSMEDHADTPNSWKEKKNKNELTVSLHMHDLKSETNLSLEKIIIKKAFQPPFMEDQTHLTLGKNEPSTIYAGKTRERKQTKQ